MFVSIGLLGTTYLLLFGIAEVLKKYAGWPARHTRQLVHVGTGLLALLFPRVLASHWEVLLLCGSFLVLLIISKRIKILESINGIERKSFGSYLYPVVVYGLYYLQSTCGDLLLYTVPLLVLAISDPLAALIGGRYGAVIFTITGHTKSIMGVAVFFVSSLAVCLSMGVSLRVALPIALASSIAEAFTIDGFDNLTIPLVVVVVLLISQNISF